jgi:hypothetical protein
MDFWGEFGAACPHQGIDTFVRLRNSQPSDLIAVVRSDEWNNGAKIEEKADEEGLSERHAHE